MHPNDRPAQNLDERLQIPILQRLFMVQMHVALRFTHRQATDVETFLRFQVVGWLMATTVATAVLSESLSLYLQTPT